MRAVLDTNLFLSALLTADGPPASIVDAWRAGRFQKLRHLVPRPALGRLVNAPQGAEFLLVRLRHAGASPDPGDDYLLAMAAASDAQCLATGDHALLSLRGFGRTRIVTPRRFAVLIAR